MGSAFIDQNAHATLPSDETVLWIEGSCTSILRGPGDRGYRGGAASLVLRVVHHTTLIPRSTHIVWVRTEWGGLPHVFGSSRRMTSQRVSIANGVHDSIRGVSFPVFISNFGETAVTLRPKANARYVEILASGVIRMMKGDEEYPRPGVECFAQPSPRAGMPAPNPEPGSPIVGALDSRGAADPGKGDSRSSAAPAGMAYTSGLGTPRGGPG